MPGNGIPFKRLPLRNVELLYALTYRLQNRGAQNQCIGLFYGPTGIGKTEAATAVRNMTDAIILTAKDTWSRRYMLASLLKELGVHEPRGTVASLEEQCTEWLSETPDRPLIIDEADKLAKRDCLETLRSVTDGARVPLVLVGEESLVFEVQKIQRVDGRVLIRQPGVSCNLDDARKLIDYFAPGVAIDDKCLEEIRQRNRRRPRLIVSACEQIVEYCRSHNIEKLDAATFLSMHHETKAPRFMEDA